MRLPFLGFNIHNSRDTIMKITIAIIALAFTLIGCSPAKEEPKGILPEVQKDALEAAQKVEEGMKESAAELDKKAEEMQEAVEEKAEAAQEAIEEKAEEMKEAVEK
jgi:uncharacterized protein YoxC